MTRALTSIWVKLLVVDAVIFCYGTLAVAVSIKPVPEATDLLSKFLGARANTGTCIENLFVCTGVKVQCAIARARVVKRVIGAAECCYLINGAFASALVLVKLLLVCARFLSQVTLTFAVLVKFESCSADGLSVCDWALTLTCSLTQL
jgi:hypothetical protein